jgi:hypothetical protein
LLQVSSQGQLCGAIMLCCCVCVVCAGIGVPAAAASGMMAANSLVGVFDHLGVLNELAL